TAQDERYRAAASAGNQEFRVDGDDATFEEFAAALTEGDLTTYDRRSNLETFTLVNRAAPAVQGLVTETFNPDGSPVAPEPTDGGEITLLTDTEGRRTIRYSADAVFRIDGAIATEAEFEAARTAGDRVTYQPGDPGRATAEEIALVNRDLTGTITDIVEGADTYAVVTLAGVVYDDLVYTGAVFGGTDSYYVDD